MKPQDRTVDFNTLLVWLNLLVACLIGGALWAGQSNEYADSQTLMLGLVLSLETHIVLMLERAQRDPFILLLAFSNILYYALRVFTLSVLPFSLVFDRYAYDARDSNFALLFIIIANVFLYGGLLLAPSRQKLTISADRRQARFPLGVLLIIMATFALTYLSGRSEVDSSRIISVLLAFISPIGIETMVLVYFLLFRHSLSRSFVIATATLLLLEMIARTLFGSRSALIGFVQTLMMVALAMAGRIRLPRAWVITGVALMPVGLTLAIGAFALSTYNRAAKDAGGYTLDFGRALQLADAAGADLTATNTIETLLRPVLARAGFFDFSAEIIVHRDEYKSVINVPAYGKSIIDNILTPGFDVFDQPKIANSLLFAYRNWGWPSKAELEKPGVYESDQLGIYGEFYALFGYSSLPLLFLLAYALKHLYMRADSVDPFLFVMKRVIVLSIFQRSLDSFGMDWTIGEVLPLVILTFLYAPLFSSGEPSTHAVSV
ncbi:MAG TPA: hypothetical protein VI653_01595 [Steroidobacteraceae bacterium]